MPAGSAPTITVAKLNVPITGDTKGLTRAFSGATGLAKNFATKFGSIIKTGFKAAAIGATAAAAAVGGLSAGLVKLAVDAAPLVGIKGAFDGIAQSAGVAGDEMLSAMQKGTAGMVPARDLMMSFNKAAQLVGTDFAVQLPDAMQYLGKVAAATGEDMNYMLNSLVVGVGRLSPMILDNLGIQVRLSDATARASEMFGVQEKALSKAQQQAGMMNVVLEKLAANTAAMPDVVGTTAAEVAKFKTTLKDTKDQVGMALQPALSSLMGTLNGLAERVLPKVVDFVQNKVGPVVEMLAETFGKLVGKADSAGKSVIAKFAQPILDGAKKAFTWGVELVTQLAKGIIEGAAKAITAAMKFITGMLSAWLAPGSPPRVAPNIDKWGTAAFEAFLSGFGMAQFDILEGLQSPLEKALSSLVSLGDITQGAASKAFVGVSKGLAEAIDKFMETGQVGEGVFESIRKAGGRYGDELEALARKQFELAGATRAIQEAEDALKASRQAAADAQDQVTSLMDEYNRLRASGADDATLEAKRREFELAQDQLSQAKAQEKQDEKTLSAAESRLEPLREEIELQQRLLDQMYRMSETAADAARAAASAAAEAAGGAADKVAEEVGDELAEGIADGIGDIPELVAPAVESLGSIFSKAKDQVKKSFEGFFDPIKDAWEDLKTNALNPLAEAWDKLTSKIGELHLETVIDPLAESLGHLVKGEYDLAIEDLADAVYNFGLNVMGWDQDAAARMARHVENIGAKAKIAAENTWKFIEAVADQVLVSTLAWWKENGGAVSESLQRIAEALLAIFDALTPETKLDSLTAMRLGIAGFVNIQLDKILEGLEGLATILEWIAGVAERWNNLRDLKIPPASKLAWSLMAPLGEEDKPTGMVRAYEEAGARIADEIVPETVQKVTEQMNTLDSLPPQAEAVGEGVTLPFEQFKVDVADPGGYVPVAVDAIMTKTKEFDNLPIQTQPPLDETVLIWSERMGNITDETKQMVDDVMEMVEGLTDDLIAHLTSEDLIGKFKEAGKQMVAGIKAGVDEKWPELEGKMSMKIKGIVEQVLRDLGILSPSKVFQDIGRNMVLGLMKGWGDQFGDFQDKLSATLGRVSGTPLPVAATSSSVSQRINETNRTVNLSYQGAISRRDAQRDYFIAKSMI